RETTSEPIKYFVYNHQRKDHVGMASMMPKGTIFVGHNKVAARLHAAKDPNRPVPSVTFSDFYTLKLGNQRIELANKGRSHEDGSTYVYFPRQKILMLVDVIFPGWVPFKDMALAKSVSGFIKAHDHVLAYDFDTFVGGHLTRLGNRKDVEVAKEYILDVMANAQKALQSVNFMAIAKKTGFQNRWALFKTYLDAVAEHCAKATLAKWINVLGGADVFTFSHCWLAQEEIRIDF
ncbi:MAG: MBL fold metallo-hydrolase, partial [SAR324 cluster bacterium]|nr:MBL fold metallo-hydrolase [SAR324 cluster bacterium]